MVGRLGPLTHFMSSHSTSPSHSFSSICPPGDQDWLGLPSKKDSNVQHFCLLPLSSPPGTLLSLFSSKDINPRPRDAESPHPGRLQVRRHSLGPRAAPILPRQPLQWQLPAGLSLTDPGRCLRRRRRRLVRRQEAWQTLTAQRSIPPGPKLRPLRFPDP